jgi:hypothetical protein
MMIDLSEFVIRTGRKPKHHPFAHVQLVATSEIEAAQAVQERQGAYAALTAASRGEIVSRTCPHFTSSDLRVLAIHGLTKRTRLRVDGSSVVTISHKGRDVLRLLREGLGG